MVQPSQHQSVYHKLLNAIDRHFKYIVIVLFIVQGLKGLALYQNSYSRGQYLWSYSAGFIKRGIIGTFAIFLEDHNSFRMLGIINFVSYFSYFLFISLLYKLIMRNAQTIMQKIVALLFLSSPFLIAIGALLGYFDLIVLSLSIILYNICAKKNIPVLLYFFLVVIAIAVHELSLFFLVIPMLFLIWMHPTTTQRKKYYLIGCTMGLCVIYLLLSSHQNTAFIEILDDRLSTYKPILSNKANDELFALSDYALKNNFLQDFKLSRLGMLIVLLPIYGFFILVSNIIVLPELLKGKKYRDALLYLLTCYAPMLIIIVGWDTDRFVCDGILSAYISFLVITKSYPIIIERKPQKTQFAIVVALSIIALLTYYPISNYGAEGETLISKNQQKILLQYPDKIISRFKNLVAPKKNMSVSPENLHAK